jgi:hypothetical protein
MKSAYIVCNLSAQTIVENSECSAQGAYDRSMNTVLELNGMSGYFTTMNVALFEE